MGRQTDPRQTGIGSKSHAGCLAGKARGIDEMPCRLLEGVVSDIQEGGTDRTVGSKVLPMDLGQSSLVKGSLPTSTKRVRSILKKASIR
mmetsp:Transcript_34904/g.74242  ORF Transcript_34904/g.74242 Transcript_34904/m.74242 type:complete len:89 (+) Transcript_34904:71-337(+)